MKLTQQNKLNEHGYTTTADIRYTPTEEEKQVVENYLKSLKEKQENRTDD